MVALVWNLKGVLKFNLNSDFEVVSTVGNFNLKCLNLESLFLNELISASNLPLTFERVS